MKRKKGGGGTTALQGKARKRKRKRKKGGGGTTALQGSHQIKQGKKSKKSTKNTKGAAFACPLKRLSTSYFTGIEVKCSAGAARRIDLALGNWPCPRHAASDRAEALRIVIWSIE
jgi:hypothetical protein